MAGLSLKHVCKIYPNGFQAVKDFNLEIEDKEFIVLAGPSGCGKSTTLRMVAGLEEITSGEIGIGGKRVNDLEPRERDIAMMFQNCALYPDMTVYENMEFGLKLRKLPKDDIDRMVREAAGILDLEQVLDRNPDALSDEQRQRVAMGRAIVRNPKALLMDEPLSNLDARLRGQTRMELSGLHRKLGATILYVTRDQAEAMALGTRIVVMKDGVIQQADTPQNLYDRPCNKFVAGFIGAPEMNLIPAAVGTGGTGVTLSLGGHAVGLPPEKAKKLEDGGYIGRDVILGIRPEDLRDEESFLCLSPNSVIEAEVRSCETQGEETYLYFDLEDTDCAARVSPGAAAAAGDKVRLALDLTRVHIFDKDTEQVITN